MIVSAHKTFIKLQDVRKTLLDIEEYVKEHCGLNEIVKLNNNDNVQKFLYEKLRYPILETTENNTPSTKKTVLDDLLTVKGGSESFIELCDFDGTSIINEQFTEYRYPMAKVVQVFRKYNKLYIALLCFLDISLDKFNADLALYDERAWNGHEFDLDGDATKATNNVSEEELDFSLLESEISRRALVSMSGMSEKEVEDKLTEFMGSFTLLNEYFMNPVNRRRLSDIYLDSTTDFSKSRYFTKFDSEVGLLGSETASEKRKLNNYVVQNKLSTQALEEMPLSLLKECISNTFNSQNINTLNEYVDKINKIIK